MLRWIKNLFNKTTETKLNASEKINNLFDSLEDEVIILHLGEDFLTLDNELCTVIQELREEIKNECGFIIPEINILDNNCLQENEFKIYIRGNLADDGFIIPNKDGIKDELYCSLKTVLYKNLQSIFTSDITERYINAVQRKNSRLVWNITNVLSILEIKTILLDLINYGKSINNIGYIFEKIGEEVLLDGGFRDNCSKKFNPHTIAQQVVKQL